MACSYWCCVTSRRLATTNTCRPWLWVNLEYVQGYTADERRIELTETSSGREHEPQGGCGCEKVNVRCPGLEGLSLST